MIRFNTKPLGDSFHSILFDISSLILPCRCITCNSRVSNPNLISLCDDCWSKIEVIKRPYCLLCAKPFSPEVITSRMQDYTCGDCLVNKKHYDLAASAFVYSEAGRDLIHHLKFNKFIRLANIISDLMLQKYLYEQYFGKEDIIIPVPLHPSRSRKRGFNQSTLLAEKLSENIGIPVRDGIVRRIKKTVSLYDKSRAERLKILKGAFSVKDNSTISGKKILLIDDVYTTGSTVNEVSKVIRKAGARWINVLTASRTMPFPE